MPFVATGVATVDLNIAGVLTPLAARNHFRSRSPVHLHPNALIKDVTLPLEALPLRLLILSVSHDAPVKLIDLREPLALQKAAELFTANSRPCSRS